MLFSRTLLLIGASFAAGNILQYAAELPTCGLYCIAEAIAASPCALSNATCICTNNVVKSFTTTCVTANCTVLEQLQVAKVNEEGCAVKEENYQTLLKTVAIVFCTLAELFILVRLYVNVVIAKNFKNDDWVIATAGAINILYLILAVMLFDLGFGKNIWDIELDRLNTIFEFYIIDECLYLTILSLTKLSLLLFLKRIFPAKKFQMAVWFMVVFVTAWGILIVILTIFQCDPVSYAWTRWSETGLGSCRDINAQTYATAAINIVQDICILVLPLPSLWKLQTKLRKKLQLFAMFSVGLFVTIISIVRLQSLIYFNTTVNPTMDYVPATYWSAIESEVAIMCTCMPAFRFLLGHIFPTVFNSTVKSRNNTSHLRTGPKSTKARTKNDEFHELSERSVLDDEHEGRAGLRDAVIHTTTTVRGSSDDWQVQDRSGSRNESMGSAGNEVWIKTDWVVTESKADEEKQGL